MPGATGKLSPPHPSNSYTVALTPGGTVFGDRAFGNYMVKWGHKGRVSIQWD